MGGILLFFTSRQMQNCRAQMRIRYGMIISLEIAQMGFAWRVA
jgi:hypothetical protein